MRKIPVVQKIRSFFLDRPLPDVAFHLESRSLSGLVFSRRERRVKDHFFQALSSGVLHPSFDRSNLPEPDALRALVEAGLEKFGVTNGTVALLIPDSAARVFILTAEAVPSSEQDREEFIRWRVGKQMPLVHEDIRFDYLIPRGTGPGKLAVALARESVIREYEDLFKASRMKIGTVTLPSLSLINIFHDQEAPNGIVINVEEEYLSFLAVIDSEWSLFRQKGVVMDGRPSPPLEQKIDQVVKEVENTVHFLEDKEKRKMERLWVRSGLLEDSGEVVERLRAKLKLPVHGVEDRISYDWDIREKNLFAPLMGQFS